MIFLRRMVGHPASILAPFVLLPSLALAQSPRTQQRQQSSAANTQPAPDLRGTQQSPLVIQVEPSTQGQQETTSEREAREEQAAINRSNLITNRVIAGIAFLQLIVFGWQARRLKQTIAKMDEIAAAQSSDTQSAIEKMAVAANAAERSANVAEKSLIIPNRAYIDVADWTLKTVIPNRDDPTHFFIEFRLVTASPTPALIEELLMTYPAGVKGRTVLNATVSQKSSIPHNIRLGPLTDEQRARLRNGPDENVSFDIAGRVIYRDVFNRRRCRRFHRIFMFYGSAGAISHAFVFPDNPGVNIEEDWGQETEPQPERQNSAH